MPKPIAATLPDVHDNMPQKPFLCAEEFRRCRLSLSMTQIELARALRMTGQDEHMIDEWERGLSQIPGPVSLAIEYLLFLWAIGEPLPVTFAGDGVSE